MTIRIADKRVYDSLELKKMLFIMQCAEKKIFIQINKLSSVLQGKVEISSIFFCDANKHDNSKLNLKFLCLE